MMIHLHHLIHHLIHIYYYIKYLFNPSFDTHLILVYYVLTRFIAIYNLGVFITIYSIYYKRCLAFATTSFIAIYNLGAFITIYSIYCQLCLAFTTIYSIYYWGNL